MTPNTRPFAFDREFAADGTVLRDGERIRRVLTEAEARALADEAAAAARQGEEAVAAKASADALKQIAGRLQALVGRLSDESEALREDAVRLAMAAARAVSGAALDQFGADTVEACIREALADLRAEPRIAIRVRPDLADAIAERIYAYAEREGCADAVLVRADAECGPGDCVIEWRNGAIERTTADIEARITRAVETWLARPAADRDAEAAGPAGGGAAA